MASLGVSGKGTLFRRWSGSAWVNLAEVKSINGPTMSREMIDVTSLDSTGGYREFIASYRDGGTVDLTMIFRRDTYDLMHGDFEDDTVHNYEIVLPDGDHTSLEFEGYVNEVPLSIVADDAVTADVSIKVTSAPTVNSGSGS